MPRVRMLTGVAGPYGQWDEGEEIDMTPEQASVWADGVRGELVRPSTVVETPERNVVARRGGVQTPETRAR
jgi:hypothetical protein